MFIVSKLNYSLNVSNSARKSIKDGVDIGTVLHADDSELVFFVDPHKESFVLVVEDTTARWPVAVKTDSFEETITLLEKEMVSNKLLAILFAHSGKGIESTSEVTLEGLASCDNLSHDFIALFLGDSRTKRVFVEIATNTNTSRNNHFCFVLR